jgi:probable rRNA maturation factor
MIEIQQENPSLPEINQEMIQFGVSITLSLHEKSSVDVTIRLTGDDEVRKLNYGFRGIDQTTDVLSFNQDVVDLETSRFYLGDIIISLDRVRQQASENSHTMNEECTLLAVHGTLHLLGYDHATQDEKEEMWKMQEKVLKQVLKEFQVNSG